MSPPQQTPIMLLSWAIPPHTSGSAVIVGNLAQQFTADEMIVVGEQPIGDPLHTWDDSWPRLIHATRGWPRHRRGARWFRWLQFPVLVVRCVAIARRYCVRTIVTVYPKAEFLFAGYLTACWAGAKFFPYFHNTYVENRSGLALAFARWLQHRVFESAERVLVISEGLAELYRTRYPGVGVSVLPHSFGEDLPSFEIPPVPQSRISLIMSGNVNESCRDAALRISRAVAQLPGATLLLLSGTHVSMLAQLGMIHEQVQHATVSRDRLLAELKKADIVVLPHGLTGAAPAEEYQTIFPTRTVEYLICGRPILAHAPPNCYLTRFLKKHQCALVVDTPDTDAIVEAIERLREDADLRIRLVRNALDAAREFQGQRVAATLRRYLEELG
jgi:glycosyltransferase involved in cell wall biosynthesis